MKKQLALIGMFALLVCVGLSGCNQISNTLNPEKKKFVGTWKHNETQMIFFSDGTIPNFAFGATGNWEIKDGKLVVNVIGNGGSMDFVYSYKFSNDDKTLTLTLEQPNLGMPASPTVYTKQ